MNKRVPLYIFSGPDKAGKTTQAGLLEALLVQQGNKVTRVHFPTVSTSAGRAAQTLVTQEDIYSFIEFQALCFLDRVGFLKASFKDIVAESDAIIFDRFDLDGAAYTLMYNGDRRLAFDGPLKTLAVNNFNITQTMLRGFNVDTHVLLFDTSVVPLSKTEKTFVRAPQLLKEAFTYMDQFCETIPVKTRFFKGLLGNKSVHAIHVSICSRLGVVPFRTYEEVLGVINEK